MKRKINKKEFMNILNGNNKVLYMNTNNDEENTKILFDYDYDRFSDVNDEDFEFYLDDNILILKENDEDNYYLYAWLTKDVIFEDMFSEYISDEKCIDISISTCGFLPSSITKYFGGLAFTCKGMIYEDEKVKKLDDNDAQAILALCDILKDGNFYEKDEAETFRYIVENKLYTTYGIYDQNDLVALVFYRIIEERKLCVLSEIVVKREYQGHGYGKRLVKKVLNVCPTYNYIYTCHNKNYRSIGLAESCGFKFCGVKNFRLKISEE